MHGVTSIRLEAATLSLSLTYVHERAEGDSLVRKKIVVVANRIAPHLNAKIKPTYCQNNAHHDTKKKVKHQSACLASSSALTLCLARMLWFV